MVQDVFMGTPENVTCMRVYTNTDVKGVELSELVDFVAGVTDEKSPEYLEPADRIATFDMDGTILCETAPLLASPDPPFHSCHSVPHRLPPGPAP